MDPQLGPAGSEPSRGRTPSRIPAPKDWMFSRPAPSSPARKTLHLASSTHMGKSQKKRAIRRHNPVRVPDSVLPRGLEAAASTSSKKDAILPLIQKLQGADAQERIWACSAVSNLIQNDPSTRRLLQGKNIVGALITRLSDSVEEVVVEAAGALRNLCIDGGYDICAEMYNKNILSPLKSSIPKIANTFQQLLTSPKTAPENATQIVYGFAENIITILWCLSETSNKALNAVNQLSLVPFLMAFLENYTKLPSRTVAAAAQCLYVLTDDNWPALVEVRTNFSYACCLSEIASSNNVTVSTKGKEVTKEQLLSSQFLKILSAGILRNVTPFPFPSNLANVDLDKTIILPLLGPVLTSVSLPEISNRVSVLLSQQDENIINKSPKKNAPRTDHRSSTEIELEYLERSVRIVELALEILTSICATLPDPEPDSVEEEDVLEEEGADEPDMNGGEEENGMEIDGTKQQNGHSQDIKIEPPSSNLSHIQKIIEPVLQLIHPTELSFPPISNTAIISHPPTTSALSAVHIRALECLNNFFLSLSVHPNPEIALDLNSGKKVWDTLWNALSVVGVDISGRGQERRKEMWEVGVGVLWGISNVWKGRIVPNSEQIQILVDFCNVSTDGTVKVKCIGTLECLAQCPETVEANNLIAAYLISLLSVPESTNPTSVEPLLQAASALIDIYSDENMPYDINFRKGNFLDALSLSIPGMKKAVKGIDMRKEGGTALRSRGEEVLENLVAFVEYRQNLKL